MFLFSYSACSKAWGSSFKVMEGCRCPQPELTPELPGLLPLLGHWHLGSGFGLHARCICSLRLLIETWKGGFHWILCVAQGEGQPRKQNKGKRPVDAEHMQIGLRKTTVLLFTSFFTKTRSRSHFAYSSNPVGSWIFPAFVQLESLFLTIWLLFLLPFSPAKHLDSFSKSSFIVNVTYAALPALGVKQNSSLSLHFLLTFLMFFLTSVVPCFALQSAADRISVFIV